jgi:hypothetical protein
MTTSWTLAMGLGTISPEPHLFMRRYLTSATAEVRLRVDRVGLSANKVTYAVLGQPVRYWRFFPPEPRPALRAVASCANNVAI